MHVVTVKDETQEEEEEISICGRSKRKKDAEFRASGVVGCDYVVEIKEEDIGGGSSRTGGKRAMRHERDLDLNLFACPRDFSAAIKHDV